MSINIAELFHQAFGDQLVKEAGSFLGENLDHTRSAVTTLVPAFLRGVIEKASDFEGAGALLDHTRNVDEKFLKPYGGIFGGGPATNDLLEAGDNVIEHIFGKESRQVAEILDMVSSSNQIQHSSASSLLKMISPVALNLLGKQVKDQQLDAPGLQRLLQSQMENVKQASPLALADIFERTKPEHEVTAVPQNHEKTSVANAPPKQITSKPEDSQKDRSDEEELLPVPPKPSFAKRMGPWLVLFTLAALMFWGMRSCGGMSPELKQSLSSDDVEMAADEQEHPADPGQTEAIPSESESAEAQSDQSREKHVIALPGGAALTVDKGSFAHGVSTFLSAGARAAEGRFKLDEVEFIPETAELTARSNQQLQHLTYLMQAFTNVQIKVENWVDGEGDASSDLVLSEQRALAIKKKLNEMGVANERIESTGYGAEGLEADTDARESATNQKVEVLVISR